jgi:hypothetical protein
MAMLTATNKNFSEANSPDDERSFNRLKAELHERLISSLDLSAVRFVDPEILGNQLRRGAEELCMSLSMKHWG